MSNDILSENLKHIASAVATQFGPACEVVVHDLSHPENSIVYIVGDVTGRRVGAPVTDFVLKLLASSEVPEDAISYISKTRDGRTLKSSTVFVRDLSGHPIGVFCINYDISNLIQAGEQLSELTSPSATNLVQKSFSSDVPDLLQNMIQEAVHNVLGDFKPGDEISKEERLEIIEFLEEQGVFKIRKSVPAVAEILNVSRHTIYKDIKSLSEHEKTPVDKLFLN